MSYYNTTNAAGRELKIYRGKAKTQGERILDFFREADAFLYTPSEIRRYVFDDAVPLTSVRRAMTDLTDERKLVKTSTMRLGPYGRPEHAWRRNVGNPAQRELML